MRRVVGPSSAAVDTQRAAFATHDVLSVVERKAAEMPERTQWPPSVTGQERYGWMDRMGDDKLG